jgi:serine/threonine protein kinase
MMYCCVGRHANKPGELWCRECGSIVEGALIGDYRVLSFVGKGSTAEVYLAEQTAPIKRKVVIKILPQDLSDSRIETFQREASLLASLSHPYILPIYSYGVFSRPVKQQEDEAHHDGDGGEESVERVRCVPYLVLAYAERGSLADLFVREGYRPWSLNRVVTIARETADALDYAHSQGVLHRDVKPANILHMGTHVLLSDFSVATLIDADASHLTAPWAGSPAYMAPEVWQLRPGRYSDQYALAVSCFHLLSGDLPLRRDKATSTRSWAHLHNFVQPRSILELRSDLPLAVDMVLQRALSKKPHDRYSSVSAFAADLHVAAEDDTQGLVVMIDTQEISSAARSTRTPVSAGPDGTAARSEAKEEQPEQPQRQQVRVAFTKAGAPQVAPAVLPAPAPVVREPITSPGSLSAASQPWQPPHTLVAEVSAPSLVSTKQRGHWVRAALLLNAIVCLALLAESALAERTFAMLLYLVLGLWPALLTGPLLATFFRGVRYRLLSRGLFWGAFFGLANGLLSALACVGWFMLVLFVWGLHCHSGCDAGAGWATLIQEVPPLVSFSALPVVLGLWFSVIGGALIGLAHIREEL